MGELKNLGFQLYRLRDAQETCELLIYDTKTKLYHQYSYRRGLNILKQTIEKLFKMDLHVYMVKNNFISIEDKKPVSEAVFNEWVRENIKLIDNIGYKPIEKKIYEEEGKFYFNVYEKSNIFKQELKEGEFSYIKSIILNLTGNDETAYLYFCKWLAWQVQNPQQRLATSIVFKGEQGSGKTLFTDYILKPIFKRNFLEISQSDLSSEFDEYILGKQIIVANEVIYNDKNLHYSQSIKKKVTDNYINIRRKFKESLYVKNYSHWIFTSNSQVPIKIEKGDRRFSVFKSKKLKDGLTLFTEFKKVCDEELKHFLFYLLNLHVEFHEINKPYENTEKKEIIEASLNSVELFFETIIDAGGIDELNKEYSQAEDWFNIIEYIETKNNHYVKIESLYELYKKFCNYAGIKNVYGRNGFTSMLRHLDFHLTIIKDLDKKSRRVMLLGDLK